MPAQWTADLIGKMHLYGISSIQLATAVGWNAKYLSTVLNGHKSPSMAEGKLRDALETLITEKKEHTV